jgi:hypothetical protein
MKIEGSCHCGLIDFTVESRTPYPYRRCHCVRCRKTNGGSGYAINVMGEADSLHVNGQEHLRIYRPEDEPLESYFCGNCGSHLYIVLPDWPRWVYPFASAIDTPLPSPPETFHIFLDEAVTWLDIPDGDEHHHFGQNTEESIEQWHQRLGLIDSATDH